jgi:hypothetical protein
MPAAGKRIFSSSRNPDWVWGPSNPSCSRYRGSSPPVKRPEHEFDYSEPSSAHVNHDWSCTSKPVDVFMRRTLTLPSRFDLGYLTHWHTQPAVRRVEPSMPLLLILALCQ